jgi:hypothetical protein
MGITLQDLVTKHTGLTGVHERYEQCREKRGKTILSSCEVRDGQWFTTSAVVRILSNYTKGVKVTTDQVRPLLNGMVEEGLLVRDTSMSGAARVKYRKAPENTLAECWRPTRTFWQPAQPELGRYFPHA